VDYSTQVVGSLVGEVRAAGVSAQG